MTKRVFPTAVGLAFFFFSLAGAAAPRSVWIDSDLSLGSPFREVDDGYALLYALRSPELEVVGVSSTFGNAPLPGTTARLRKSLSEFGAEIPVAPGAPSASTRGCATLATVALAHAVRRQRLTYLALGPLTNLATFLQLHPEESNRFREVIMVAGKTPAATLGFGPGERFRIHDANLAKDPAAVRAVFASPVPIVLAPIEVSAGLQLNRHDVTALAASGPPARYLAQNSRAWLWFWQSVVRQTGGPLFDALAVAAAARPDLVRLETCFAGMDGDDTLLVRPTNFPGARKVLFCTGFSRKLKAALLNRLTDQRAKSSNAPPGQ